MRVLKARSRTRRRWPLGSSLVDSGAWIALALSRDPLHAQAREQWDLLRAAGARLHTSIPVVIETFIFLDRNANRDVAPGVEKLGSPAGHSQHPSL